MRYMLSVLAAALGGLVLCATARASYLEEEQGLIEPVPVRPAPRRPLPPPRPIPIRENPLMDAVRRLSVGEPYTYRGLTVFPLGTSHVEDSSDYLSIEEAFRRGVLLVTEKDSGSVPVVLGENRGRRPILMLGGEIVAGGKQNRILQEDVLLPAHSGRVELPVLCVERGRWTFKQDQEFRKSSMAALGVRAAAQGGRPQAEIWDSVHYYQSTLSAPSETEDLDSVQESPEVRKAARDYVESFRRHWHEDAVGMVVARYGRIVGADVFCNPQVFRKHRDRILESYAIDCYAISKREGRERQERLATEPARRDVERFLERTLSAHYEWRATAGEGRLLAVSGARIGGLGLICRDALIHASLFPQDEAIIMPTPLRNPLLRHLPPEAEPQSAE